MPTAAQLSRLAALEAKAPASATASPMAKMTPNEIRQAIEGLMVAIGGDDEDPVDPILAWARTCPDSDLEQFRDGVKPDNAGWGVWPIKNGPPEDEPWLQALRS